MSRSIATLLSLALLLAGPAAVAQSSKPAPIVAAGPAPAVPWCPPGQARDAAGKCMATISNSQTSDHPAGPGAALGLEAAKPVATPPVAAMPVLAARPKATAGATPYARPPVAGPKIPAMPAARPPRPEIAVGEPNGDCATRGPNLVHDSRSPSGCAPCPRGRVPNSARQACVIPIPRRY